MDDGRGVSRRGLLAAGAAGAAGLAGTAAVVAAGVGGSAVLAGCSGGCTSWSSGLEPSAKASVEGGREVLAKLADLPVGHAVTARRASGDPVVVSRPSADEVVAFSAKCTHHQCLVNPEAGRFHCVVHDGWFDGATGAAQSGPPKTPLPPVAVTVVDGLVVTTA